MDIAHLDMNALKEPPRIGPASFGCGRHQAMSRALGTRSRRGRMALGRVARWALAGGLFAALGAPALARAADAPTTLPAPVVFNYGIEDTARSAAMGGAMRALGSGNTALFLNPAAVAETRVYHLEAEGQFMPESARQCYGGSIVDSVTGRLGGGVAVTGGFMDPNGLNRSYIDARLALGYPITDKFMVGIAARYVKITQNGPTSANFKPSSMDYPFGVSDRVSGGIADPSGGRFAFVNQMTFDVGLAIKPAEGLYLGILGQNLAYAGNSLLPLMVGGGLGVGTKDFSIEVDGVADLNSWNKSTGRFSGGAEYLIANHVPIRAGVLYDTGAKNATASGGLGFLATEFSIEASVKRTIATPGGTSIVVSVAYFLESSGLTRSSTPEM
jgi:hypothetical protein